MSLDAIAGGRALAVWGLMVQFPGSITARWGNAGYTSVSGGHFQGVIKSLSAITRAASGRDGRLPAVQFTARMYDHDRSLARFLSGVYAKQIRGSAVTLRLMTPTVAWADCTTFFSGQVVRWSVPEPFVVELVCRTDDERINRPSFQPTIDRNTWSNAAPEVYNKVAPVLYGTQDVSTQRATGPGMLPLLLVDQGAYRYLLCVGRAKTVTRVYVGELQISSSLYTTEYLTLKGRIYTLVKFDDAADATAAGVADSDGVALPNVEVTCDADGYETVGDGSGSVITRPVSILSHFLSNFVLGEYMTGAWLATNALIDVTAELADNVAIDAGGSFYSSERITGADAIAAYCTSFERRCFWSKNFQVGFGADPVFAQPYTGPVISWHKMEVSQASFVDKDHAVTSRITARQCYSSAEDSYFQTLDIEDAGASIESVREMDRPWSEAR